MAVKITQSGSGRAYYNVNIDGVDYIYTPEEFVNKGFVDDGLQAFDPDFLKPGVFDTASKYTLPTTEGLTSFFKDFYDNPTQGYVWRADSAPVDNVFTQYKPSSAEPLIQGLSRDPDGNLGYLAQGATNLSSHYITGVEGNTIQGKNWNTTITGGGGGLLGSIGRALGGAVSSIGGGVSDLFSGVSDLVHDVGESPIAQALAVYAAGAALGPAGAAAASGAIAKDQGATDEQALKNAAIAYAVQSAKDAMAAPTEPAPVVDSSPPVPTGVEVNPVPLPNVTGVDLGPAVGTVDPATQAALDAAARNLATTGVPAPTPTGVEVNPVPTPSATGVDLGPATGTLDPATQAALDNAARAVNNPTLWDSLKQGWNTLPDIAKNAITSLGTGALLSSLAPQQDDSGTGYQRINWSWSPISAPTAEQATSQVVPSSFTLPDLLTETITRTPYSMPGQITDPTVSLAQDIIGRPITYAPLVQPVVKG